MDEDYRSWPPHQRPDVEVLVDGEWVAGELHAWAKREGAWWGHVTYRTGVAEQYRRTVPADHIRDAANDDERA